MRRGIRRLLAYWRAERRTIAQGFVALLIATAGSLVAGVVLGKITGTLERLPGLMVLMPVAIATRGNLFAATVLTLAISLGGAALARIVAVAFGVTTISLADLVVISILGGVLSSLFVGAFALGLSVAAYRREWDLDSVAAPLGGGVRAARGVCVAAPPGPWGPGGGGGGCCPGGGRGTRPWGRGRRGA